MSTVTLTAYNVKTKEKNVPIQDAVITKTAKGAYMAQGHDGKGNKLTTLLGEERPWQPSKKAWPNKDGRLHISLYAIGPKVLMQGCRQGDISFRLMIFQQGSDDAGKRE